MTVFMCETTLVLVLTQHFSLVPFYIQSVLILLYPQELFLSGAPQVLNKMLLTKKELLFEWMFKAPVTFELIGDLAFPLVKATNDTDLLIT